MSAEPGRRLWSLVALGLALVQLPVLIRTGADPAQSDFANYWTPAFILAEGGDVGALYDRDVFAAAMMKAGLSGLGSFVPHPPANALWLLPLASFPPQVAKAAWSMILVASLAIAILAIRVLLPGRSAALVAIVGLAPTLAIRNGLAFGQPYLILSALIVAGALALEKKRDFLAGFLLGLGVSFKPYALGIGLLLVHRDRLRALAGFVGGAVLPSFALWAITGPGPFQEFGSKVLPWMIRGDIQDPFSPVWGSAQGLVNRLWRFEPDLNPHPWLDLPTLALFLGSAIPSALLATGVLTGRRALGSRRPIEAVGIGVAFALAASPLAASYHLVLLTLPVAALIARHSGSAIPLTLLGWAALGSPAVNAFRSAAGILAPLAYLRFFALVALALVLAWPFLDRRLMRIAILFGIALGAVSASLVGPVEAWPRVVSARGYSMMKPYFCGANLRWLSPSVDGHRLDSHGAGEDCAAPDTRIETAQGATVGSRFTDGSWNLYVRPGPGAAETQVTRASANEVDPVLTPDGCAIVFASDQGRGLGSTALYRLDISRFTDSCGRSEPSAFPR